MKKSDTIVFERGESMAKVSQHRYEWDEAWKRENTKHVGLRLNIRTDADIIAAIEGRPAATEIKRLIRLGLEYEAKTKAESE